MYINVHNDSLVCHYIHLTTSLENKIIIMIIYLAVSDRITANDDPDDVAAT